MKKAIQIFFLTATLLSCNSTDNNVQTEKKSFIDTLSKRPVVGYNLLDHCLKAVNESRLDVLDTLNEELRFYYLGPQYKGFYQFYKVSLKDSTLLKKEFGCVDPTGSNIDTTLSLKTYKLKHFELEIIRRLMEKSMIWSLEQKEERGPGLLDCEYYIYESIRPKDKFFPSTKSICLVERYCPTNIDYVNLGEYLKSLTGEKSYYKEVNYWH